VLTDVQNPHLSALSHTSNNVHRIVDLEASLDDDIGHFNNKADFKTDQNELQLLQLWINYGLMSVSLR